MSSASFDVGSIAALLRQTEANLSALKPAQPAFPQARPYSALGAAPAPREPTAALGGGFGCLEDAHHLPRVPSHGGLPPRDAWAAAAMMEAAATAPRGFFGGNAGPSGASMELEAQVMQLRTLVERMDRKVEEELKAFLGICDKRLQAKEEALRTVGDSLQVSAEALSDGLSRRMDARMRDLERIATEKNDRSVDELWESFRRLQSDQRALDSRMQRCAMTDDLADRMRESDKTGIQRIDEKLAAFERRSVEHRAQLESSTEAWRETLSQRCSQLEQRVWESHADRGDLAEAVMKKLPEAAPLRALQEDIRAANYSSEVQQRRLSTIEAKLSKLPALESKVEFAEAQTAQQVEEQAQVARGLSDLAQRLSQKLSATEGACQRIEAQSASMESRVQVQTQEVRERMTTDLEGLQSRLLQRVEDVEARLQRSAAQAERELTQQFSALALKTNDESAAVRQHTERRLGELQARQDGMADTWHKTFERSVDELRAEMQAGLERFSRRFDEVEGQRGVADRRQAEMEGTLAALRTPLEALQARTEDLEMTTVRASGVAETLRSTVAAVQEQMRARAVEWASDSEALKVRVDGLQQRVVDTQVGVSKTQASLDEFKVHVSGIEAHAANLEEQLRVKSREWISEIDTMKGRAEVAQSRWSEASGGIQRLTANMETLRCHDLEHDSRVENVKTNVAALESITKSLQESMAGVRRYMTEGGESSYHAEPSPGSRSSVQQLAMQEMIAASEAKTLQTAGKQLNDVRTEVSELRAVLMADFRSELTELRTQVGGVEVAASRGGSNLAAADSRMHAFEDKVSSLRTELVSLRVNIQESAARVEDQSTQVRSIKEQINTMQSKEVDSARKSSETALKLSALQETVTDLERARRAVYQESRPAPLVSPAGTPSRLQGASPTREHSPVRTGTGSGGMLLRSPKAAEALEARVRSVEDKAYSVEAESMRQIVSIDARVGILEESVRLHEQRLLTTESELRTGALRSPVAATSAPGVADEGLAERSRSEDVANMESRLSRLEELQALSAVDVEESGEGPSQSLLRKAAGGGHHGSSSGAEESSMSPKAMLSDPGLTRRVEDLERSSIGQAMLSDPGLTRRVEDLERSFSESIGQVEKRILTVEKLARGAIGMGEPEGLDIYEGAADFGRAALPAIPSVGLHGEEEHDGLGDLSDLAEDLARTHAGAAGGAMGGGFGQSSFTGIQPEATRGAVHRQHSDDEEESSREVVFDPPGTEGTGPRAREDWRESLRQFEADREAEAAERERKRKAAEDARVAKEAKEVADREEAKLAAERAVEEARLAEERERERQRAAEKEAKASAVAARAMGAQDSGSEGGDSDWDESEGSIDEEQLRGITESAAAAATGEAAAPGGEGQAAAAAVRSSSSDAAAAAARSLEDEVAAKAKQERVEKNWLDMIDRAFVRLDEIHEEQLSVFIMEQDRKKQAAQALKAAAKKAISPKPEAAAPQAASPKAEAKAVAEQPASPAGPSRSQASSSPAGSAAATQTPKAVVAQPLLPATTSTSAKPGSPQGAPARAAAVAATAPPSASEAGPRWTRPRRERVSGLPVVARASQRSKEEEIRKAFNEMDVRKTQLLDLEDLRSYLGDYLGFGQAEAEHLFSKHAVQKGAQSGVDFDGLRAQYASLNPFMLAKRTDEVMVRKPGSLEGQMLNLDGVEDSEVYICDVTAQVFVDFCKRSTLLIAPCESSIFVRDCEDCVFYIACRQLRTNNCSRCTFYLYSATEPVIETSVDLAFAPWTASYPKCQKQFETYNFNPSRNLWNAVFDFTGKKDKANWRILSLDEVVHLRVELDEPPTSAAAPGNPVPEVTHQVLCADPLASEGDCGQSMGSIPQTRPALPKPPPASFSGLRTFVLQDGGTLTRPLGPRRLVGGGGSSPGAPAAVPAAPASPAAGSPARTGVGAAAVETGGFSVPSSPGGESDASGFVPGLASSGEEGGGRRSPKGSLPSPPPEGTPAVQATPPKAAGLGASSAEPTPREGGKPRVVGGMNAADSDDSSEDESRMPQQGGLSATPAASSAQDQSHHGQGGDSMAVASVSASHATSAAQLRSMMGEDSSEEDDAPAPRAKAVAKQLPKAAAKSAGLLAATKAAPAMPAEDDSDEEDVEDALGSLLTGGQGRGRGGGPLGRGLGATGGRGHATAKAAAPGAAAGGGRGFSGADLGLGDSDEEGGGVQPFGLSQSALSSTPSRIHQASAVASTPGAPAAKAAAAPPPHEEDDGSDWDDDDDDDTMGADQFSPTAKAALGLSDEASSLAAVGADASSSPAAAAPAPAAPAAAAKAAAAPTEEVSSDEDFGSDDDLPGL
eukprot:TRINITY_DN2094_c0_g1_i1.p1 TRINITY_DN2094_c0_g1~~TRINITY_DN2094_c0_g1_i1.p1  ORF type:complete len:2323 (+),score=731.23 TRINITY_DN2094_c0_g1_i1:122-7090(+)